MKKIILLLFCILISNLFAQSWSQGKFFAIGGSVDYTRTFHTKQNFDGPFAEVVSNDEKRPIAGGSFSAEYSRVYENNFTFKTGVHFVWGGELDTAVYFVPDIAWYSAEGQKKTTWHYFAIPFACGYAFNVGDRLSITPMAGVTVDFHVLRREVGTYYSHPNGSVIRIKDNYFNRSYDDIHCDGDICQGSNGLKNSMLNLSGIISIDVGVKLSERNSIKFAPVLRSKLFPTNPGYNYYGTYLYGLGMNLSFVRRLGAK